MVEGSRRAGTPGPVVPALLVVVAAALAGCAAEPDPGRPAPPAATAVDWLDTTYSLTCDGVAPGELRATVVRGTARVPADAAVPPHYDHYDVRVSATARGDLDGDGAADTAVLLSCSPQPSNGELQEVQAFAADGTRLGVLPSPRTLRRGTEIPPVYDPAGLAVRGQEIVAGMRAYGPADTHAGGPSVPLTVRWRFDGRDFVRVAAS
ncbi:hypothetical protein [Trujillonella humicola]|uniref:hypothetical protein n=1 Tax=Trujillonella humicola TaxID=3383699 RepID=UPI0039058726